MNCLLRPPARPGDERSGGRGFPAAVHVGRRPELAARPGSRHATRPARRGSLRRQRPVRHHIRPTRRRDRDRWGSAGQGAALERRRPQVGGGRHSAASQTSAGVFAVAFTIADAPGSPRPRRQRATGRVSPGPGIRSSQPAPAAVISAGWWPALEAVRRRRLRHRELHLARRLLGERRPRTRRVPCSLIRPCPHDRGGRGRLVLSGVHRTRRTPGQPSAGPAVHPAAPDC
jgi:hypothetical protein